MSVAKGEPVDGGSVPSADGLSGTQSLPPPPEETTDPREETLDEGADTDEDDDMEMVEVDVPSALASTSMSMAIAQAMSMPGPISDDALRT